MQASYRSGSDHHTILAGNRWFLLVASVVALGAALVALAACTGSGETTGTERTPGSATPSTRADATAASAAVDGASPVSFDDLLAEPARFVGQRIEVVGRVYFLSSCPPPGASPMGPCVLQGYLTDPERQVFVASDVAEAIVLAEHGLSLSCAEEAGTTACGDWANEARYSVVGVLQRRVLGGRETDQVQLDVVARTVLGD